MIENIKHPHVGFRSYGDSMRSLAILLFPIALMARSPLPPLPTPEEIKATDAAATKAERRKPTPSSHTLNVKRSTKKSKAVERADGLYLDLPTSYQIPIPIQVLLKDRIQGDQRLEADYSKYCSEKQRLVDWLVARMSEKRMIVEGKWKSESLHYVAEFEAYRCANVTELRQKRDKAKADYERLKGTMVEQSAFNMYAMFDDTLDRLPKIEKYEKDTELYTLQIAEIREWGASK